MTRPTTSHTLARLAAILACATPSLAASAFTPQRPAISTSYVMGNDNANIPLHTTLALTPSSDISQNTLVVAHLSVVDNANTQWGTLAKRVLGSLSPVSEPVATWRTQLNLTPGFTVQDADFPPQVELAHQLVAAAINEANNGIPTSPASYFARSIANAPTAWPSTGWVDPTSTIPASSMGWSQSATTVSDHFDTEELIRHMLVFQHHAISGQLLATNSEIINIIIEMIERGLADFTLNSSAIEMTSFDDSTPSTGVKMSNSTPVTIQASTNLNELYQFYFRTAGLALTAPSVNVWWYPGYLTGNITMELAYQPDMNDQYEVVLFTPTGLVHVPATAYVIAPVPGQPPILDYRITYALPANAITTDVAVWNVTDSTFEWLTAPNGQNEMLAGLFLVP
ncbi:MAG: hypothetical protein AB8H80_13210 [Planctomycetota bacterium]